MKIDFKLIMISVLSALVAVLILTKGCGTQQAPDRIEINYDSIERVIKSKLPAPDTIVVKGEDVIRWLPGTTVKDTIYLEGQVIPIYLVDDIDTLAILSHYLTQAVVYVDTIRDSALQAVITDTIFRNKVMGRGFTYKILQPTVRNVYKSDRFQLIASLQAGTGIGYDNQLKSIYGGVDLGLKFKSGTYFSIGYMAGSSHFATVRVGQVIRLKKQNSR